MALARSEESPQRFYSMSAQIGMERKAYYDILEATQKGDLDITQWLEWFLACLERAFDGAEKILGAVLRKAEFWKKHAASRLNERQRDMLNRLLDGFEGHLTNAKWARIEKCSADTALRDITDLVEKGVLRKAVGGGRSTSYLIVKDAHSPSL
jgi:Fic family protein